LIRLFKKASWATSICAMSIKTSYIEEPKSQINQNDLNCSLYVQSCLKEVTCYDMMEMKIFLPLELNQALPLMRFI
jgi:hypothetical protein